MPIKHYFFPKKTITETKAKLVKYYGYSAPSISMVKKWFTEFRSGRTSTIDTERSGRPLEVAIPETIVGRSEIESAGDCGSHRHSTWVSGFDFERSLGYEKAICKMGAAFAHNRP